MLSSRAPPPPAAWIDVALAPGAFQEVHERDHRAFLYFISIFFLGGGSGFRVFMFIR